MSWDKKQEWWKYGKDFLVVVKHYKAFDMVIGDDEGNRWNVYAFIYPQHPLFSEFNGNDMWQSVTLKLPLHGGVSLLYYHFNGAAEVTSVQVGSDYNHLGDEEFSQCAAQEEANVVFSDAETLFEYLSFKTIKQE